MRLGPKTASGCSEWPWGRSKSGYGSAYDPDRKTNVRVHRKAWELEHGPIPDGMIVCHTCDNPACVNPDHLFLGTQTDNMHDMMSKGRGKRPAVTAEQREVILTSPLSARKLAAAMGLGRNQVNLIRMRNQHG